MAATGAFACAKLIRLAGTGRQCKDRAAPSNQSIDAPVQVSHSLPRPCALQHHARKPTPIGRAGAGFARESCSRLRPQSAPAKRCATDAAPAPPTRAHWRHRVAPRRQRRRPRLASFRRLPGLPTTASRQGGLHRGSLVLGPEHRIHASWPRVCSTHPESPQESPAVRRAMPAWTDRRFRGLKTHTVAARRRASSPPP